MVEESQESFYSRVIALLLLLFLVLLVAHLRKEIGLSAVRVQFLEEFQFWLSVISLGVSAVMPWLARRYPVVSRTPEGQPDGSITVIQRTGHVQ